MIIDLDKENRIRSDEHCWRHEVRAVIKGAEAWRTLDYYTTFGSAVSAAYQREIRTTHAVGLDECLKAAEGLLRRYITVLDEIPHELAAG